MALMTMLETAQGGALFGTVAKALGTDAKDIKSAMGALCPAIAARLKDKAQQDENIYDTLLDLLDDGADGSGLDDAEAMTNAEAISDGNAILDDIYGSRNAAVSAMRAIAPSVPETILPKLSAISATAVLSALAKGRPAAAPLASAQPAAESGGGGIIATIIAAIVKGLMQGLARQLAPRRRRRSYSSYFGTRRRGPARRRTRTPLDDIFGEILGGKRR